jgi:soluble lytic murein transglycosylase-like protein
MDDISSITARISEIQQRITALSQPPAPPADDAAPAFEKTLTAAQSGGPASFNTLSNTALPSGPSGVAPPPASLGPLPVSPGAANVIPLSAASKPGDYETLIQKYAAQNNLEPSLVKAVIQTESGGNPRSVSGAGAMGLMQLMPANVKEAGISDPFDPEQNIAAGTKQLAGLLSQYHGDLDLALAGYNAGPGNVRKYGGVPPFTETQNYIHRVKAAMTK